MCTGSGITAGGNLTIVATGAGKDSNLTVQGSSLKAGNDLTLAADNKVELLAAANTSTLRSTNSSSSASVGFSYGTDGFLVNVGASRGKGKANGDDLTWTNTRADAGNTLTIRSGGDTTLKGAVATGNRVVANIIQNQCEWVCRRIDLHPDALAGHTGCAPDSRRQGRVVYRRWRAYSGLPVWWNV